MRQTGSSGASSTPSGPGASVPRAAAPQSSPQPAAALSFRLWPIKASRSTAGRNPISIGRSPREFNLKINSAGRQSLLRAGPVHETGQRPFSVMTVTLPAALGAVSWPESPSWASAGSRSGSRGPTGWPGRRREAAARRRRRRPRQFRLPRTATLAEIRRGGVKLA